MPPFTPVLSTERLTLRRIVKSDAEALFAVFSDPEVMRYWSTAPWPNITTAHEFVGADMAAHEAGRHLRLGIALKGQAELIGTCTVFSMNEACKRAELGYGMARAHWGRGHMHEALLAFVEYVFRTLALHRLEADIDPRNVASAKSLERLGFKKEGHLRERWIVNGEVSDSSLYGLLRREWNTKLAANEPQP